MKKLLASLLSLVIILGCVSAFAGEKVVIGGTPTPHLIILEQIKEDMKALGYDLELKEFTDYFLPNPATAAGELDANYFQHGPFLNAYNKEAAEKDQLIAPIAVHYEPYGLYAGTKKDLKDLAKGDSIAITNDPSNETRALLLLQDAGLIKLKDGITPDSAATKEDIAENPNEIEIVEMNAELIPSALQDVAFAVINGNYAIGAGLKPDVDALFLEPADGEAGKVYTNYIVVKPENKDAGFVKALEQVLHTQKIKDFILNYEDFQGGVIPAFEVKDAK